MHNIADIRKEYKQAALLETDVAPNPITQFTQWLQQAQQSDLLEPTAMTLATCSTEGVPSARTVLLKGIKQEGFIFYTNYNSHKGIELAQNPRCSLLFFWAGLERQVRITGMVSKIPAAESDAYFASRPIGSQIGAIASPQSQVIPSRTYLENIENELKATSITPLVRPTHWGGYLVQPVTIEFWQGRPSRLHDRLQYTVQPNGSWLIQRLAP